jgi:hypothetical protein
MPVHLLNVTSKYFCPVTALEGIVTEFEKKRYNSDMREKGEQLRQLGKEDLIEIILEWREMLIK